MTQNATIHRFNWEALNQIHEFAQEFSPLVDMAASSCYERGMEAKGTSLTPHRDHLSDWWLGATNDSGIQERVANLAAFAVSLLEIQHDIGPDNICWDTVVEKHGAWDIVALPEILLSCFDGIVPNWEDGRGLATEMLHAGTNRNAVPGTDDEAGGAS